MKGTAHISIGILSTAVLSNLGFFTPSLELYGGALIGSMFPDIDEPLSMINKALLGKGKRTQLWKFVAYFGLSIILFFTSFLNYRITGAWSTELNIVGSLSLIIAFTKHRQITHSYMFICFLSYLIFKNSAHFAISFALCGMLHIRCDKLSKDNLKLRTIELFCIGTLCLAFAYSCFYRWA